MDYGKRNQRLQRLVDLNVAIISYSVKMAVKAALLHDMELTVTPNGRISSWKSARTPVKSYRVAHVDDATLIADFGSASRGRAHARR